MQPNAQGWCDSYYGTWNVKNKPNLEVHYFMLDEHVIKMVEREKDKFNKELAKTITDLNKSVKEHIKKQSEEMKKIHASIGDLTTFMYKIVDINKLKEPEIEKKVVSKKKPKPKIDEVKDVV